MFPTQGIGFIGKELKQENERMRSLNYECNFQCSPLPCDNQELAINTVSNIFLLTMCLISDASYSRRRYMNYVYLS